MTSGPRKQEGSKPSRTKERRPMGAERIEKSDGTFTSPAKRLNSWQECNGVSGTEKLRGKAVMSKEV